MTAPSWTREHERPVPVGPEPLIPTEWRQTAASLLRRVQPADWAAVVLVAAHACLVLWISGLGGPYRDDFRLQSMAVENELLSWAFRSPESHFAPIPRLVIGAQAHLAPWDTGAAAAITTLLFGVQAMLMWLLLRTLVGPRRAALAPLLVFVLSPILTPSAGWWTQAVTLTPATIGLLAALVLVVAYWRHRTAGYAVGACLAYLFGLLSWEKALVTLPAAVGLTALFLVAEGSSFGARVRGTIDLWRLWLGMAVLTVTHLLYYVLGPFDPGGDPSRLGPRIALDYAWTNLSGALVPGLAGGPWRWDFETSPYFGIAASTVWMRLAAALLVLAVVVVAAVRAPSRTCRAVLLVLLVWLPSTTMLLLGRVTKFGLAPAFDYRYLPEVAAIATVALALAFLPLQGRTDSAHPTPRWGRWALAAALTAYVVGSVVSITRWAEVWHTNPARDYAANARGDLAGLAKPLDLYDDDLPSEILSPLFSPYNRHSRGLAPFNRGGLIAFDKGGAPGFLLSDDGTVTAAAFKVLAAARPGPAPRCGYPLNPRSPVVTVPLDRRVPAVESMFLRLNGLSGSDALIRIQLNSNENPVIVSPPAGTQISEGLFGSLLRFDSQPVDSVTLTYLSADSGLCVDKLTIGQPEPEAP
jgi:hypothetical protein